MNKNKLLSMMKSDKAQDSIGIFVLGLVWALIHTFT